MKSEVLEQISKITGIVGTFIEKQDQEISDHVKKINDLKEEVAVLEEAIEEKDKSSYELPKNFQSNIVTDLALEKLFENLSRIPASDLEDFVNKYAV